MYVDLSYAVHLQGFSPFREYWKLFRLGGSFSISHRLTCPIRNLILRARDAIKTTGSLSLLRGSPESRTTTLTENSEDSDENQICIGDCNFPCISISPVFY
jgi:hypothetical protein